MSNRIDEEKHKSLVRTHDYIRGLIEELPNQGRLTREEHEYKIKASVPTGVFEHWKHTPEAPMIYFIFEPRFNGSFFEVSYVGLYENLAQGIEYGKSFPPRPLVSAIEAVTDEERDGFIDPIKRMIDGEWKMYERFRNIERLPETELQRILAERRPERAA